MTAVELPQGWMGRRCRKWLRKAGAKVAPGGLVAEVGSWRGRSTLVLSEALPEQVTLYAIDTWAGTPDDPAQHDRLYAGAGDVYWDFRANLEGPIQRGRVVPLRMTSLEGAAELALQYGARSFDMVFIDADHRYEPVRADILAYLPLVRAGGIISGHDYNPETWPGVVQAVNEMVPNFRVAKKSSIWWARVA